MGQGHEQTIYKEKMQIATNYKKKNSILLWLSPITTMRDTAFTWEISWGFNSKSHNKKW